MNKKEVTINSKMLRNTLFSSIFSFLSVFIMEHFGKFEFTYIPTEKKETQLSPGVTEIYRYTSTDNYVYGITYHPPFSDEFRVSIIKNNGEIWKIKDLKYSDSDFYKYQNKIKYYLEATIKDYIYIIILFLIINLIFFFIKNYSINIK